MTAELAGMTRRYTFKLYPSAAQATALERQRLAHCTLYNALLEQRIYAYEHCGKTLTYFDQTAEITKLRNDPEIGVEWEWLNASSMHATAQRLEWAFAAWRDRYKALRKNKVLWAASKARLMDVNRKRAARGRKLLTMRDMAGFPRFRARDLFPGMSFKKSGWRLDWQKTGPRSNGVTAIGVARRRARPRHGHITIHAVPGRVKLRGELPCEPQALKTCELCWREGAWWLSLVVEMPPRRQSGEGTGMVRFDLIDSFAGVTRLNGGRTAGPERVWYARDGRIRVSAQ